MEIIRSRQNTLFKHLHKLADNRRERIKTGQTLLIGTHLVQSAQHAAWPMERIVIREGSETVPEIAAILQQRSSPAIWLDPALFDDIEQLPSSTGIMALAAIPQRPALATTGCCLLLDGVQDPGNVGSILRTAAAAGVDQVWLSHGCADIWSPKVIRAGMGAHFSLALLDHVELATATTGFQGPLAITALSGTQSLYSTDLRGNLLLALGSEGSGVSAELDAAASLRLHIPMSGGVESLNVGAAAAVCLFERARQSGE